MFGSLLENPLIKTLYKVFFDSFRDSNSKKFSLSRFLAAALFVMVIWFHVKAIQIMIEKKEVDHALLLEDFAFISSIILHKNYINRNNIESGLSNSVEPTVEDHNVTSIQEQQLN
jgi:hypothetical protein